MTQLICHSELTDCHCSRAQGKLCGLSSVLLPIIFSTTLTCGNKKPTDLTFLDVIADLKELMSTGLRYRDRNFTINVLCILCDALAKAFICGTKLCSGYYGCDKCD